MQASALGGSIDGMLAEYVVLDDEAVVKIPAPLSVEEGATLPCAALTAWHALVEHGKVIAGQWLVKVLEGQRNAEAELLIVKLPLQTEIQVIVDVKIS